MTELSHDELVRRVDALKTRFPELLRETRELTFEYIKAVLREEYVGVSTKYIQVLDRIQARMQREYNELSQNQTKTPKQGQHSDSATVEYVGTAIEGGEGCP